jgi:hypothetical protein
MKGSEVANRLLDLPARPTIASLIFNQHDVSASHCSLSQLSSKFIKI